MIVSVGIDAVDIERFTTWNTRTQKQLLRILSAQEIAYCLAIPSKSAERFAVRFAAREAFFKAFSSMHPEHMLSLLTTCKAIEVHKNLHGNPYLVIDWQKLHGTPSSILDTKISLTHTKTTAFACVIITQKIG